MNTSPIAKLEKDVISRGGDLEELYIKSLKDFLREKISKEEIERVREVLVRRDDLYEYSSRGQILILSPASTISWENEGKLFPKSKLYKILRILGSKNRRLGKKNYMAVRIDNIHEIKITNL
jgi:hypothetical protein